MGISQEEIVTNAQTVTKGLEALRLEHQSLLGGLKVDETVEHKSSNEDGSAKESDALREKCSLLEVNNNPITINILGDSKDKLKTKQIFMCTNN